MSIATPVAMTVAFLVRKGVTPSRRGPQPAEYRMRSGGKSAWAPAQHHEIRPNRGLTCHPATTTDSIAEKMARSGEWAIQRPRPSWHESGCRLPGAPRVFMPLFGFAPYVATRDDVAANNYRGFELLTGARDRT